MIYVSSSAALAMLENVTNKGNELRAVEFIMATYKVKMELESLNPDVLPGNWNLYPHPASTKNFGDRWVNGGGNFLKVPSSRMPLAAYPEEHNLLVNPKNIHLKEELIVLEKIPVSFLLSF